MGPEELDICWTVPQRPCGPFPMQPNHSQDGWEGHPAVQNPQKCAESQQPAENLSIITRSCQVWYDPTSALTWEGSDTRIAPNSRSEMLIHFLMLGGSEKMESKDAKINCFPINYSGNIYSLPSPNMSFPLVGPGTFGAKTFDLHQFLTIFEAALLFPMFQDAPANRQHP